VNGLLALLLPPATAFAGMRLASLALGRQFVTEFQWGVRFAIGLAFGALVFSQLALFTALAGVHVAEALAWGIMTWGVAELAIFVRSCAGRIKPGGLKPAHFWLLLLGPTAYFFWVSVRLCTREGIIEFDAVANWVFKAKILYMENGGGLMKALRDPSFAFSHMDYPMLVPCLYALNYGLLNGVNEFVNKVWPFWMMVALCLAVLSLAQVWKRPGPLAPLAVTVLCLLPGTMEFIHMDGATMPMTFYASLATLLMVLAIANRNAYTLATALLILAGCVATKVEGIFYAAIWGPVTVAMCWRRGWLRQKTIWRALIVATLCLTPYSCLRLSKPLPSPEASWLTHDKALLNRTLELFPQVLYKSIASRFFSEDTFRFVLLPDGRSHWVGRFTGMNTFVNPELFVLPWLLVGLFILSWLTRPQYRQTVLILFAVVFVQLALISFVFSASPEVQTDATALNELCCFNCRRYYYPFFFACFLGVAALWLTETDNGRAAAHRPF
jgi:hypothetical protein